MINVGDKALTDEEIAAIKEVLGEDANLDYIHSISFTDILTGESAEPGGLVEIKVPADGIDDGRTVVLVRQKADGSFEYIEGKVSKGVLTATLDGKGTVAVFDSSLSWDEIINGRQEAPAKSHGWLYAAGGAAALLLVILLFAKRRKKDEDDED
jgi:LPXTG-motif cell wall-anchored protein